MCGGKGAEFIANVKARILTSTALSNSVRGGGIAKELEPDYEPEAWVYSGEKGLVPTFAARLHEPAKGLLVERRLAIDDDLRNR
jgi:hypothetical protein